jgi:hypothetical protein
MLGSETDINSRAPSRKTNRVFDATMATGGLALIGVFVYAWQTQSTREFGGIGFVQSIFMTVAAAVMIIPTCVILGLIVSWFNKRDRLPSFLNTRFILATGAVLLMWGVIAGLLGSTAKSLYSELIGIPDVRVSEVRVAGFNSFLAQRWLFSFRIAGPDAALIAKSLGLRNDDSIDLSKSLDRDIFFSKSNSSVRQEVPGSKGLRSYFRSDTQGQGSGWITLVVDEANQRAWLYKGFQN